MQTPFDIPEIVLFRNLSVELKLGWGDDELLLKNNGSRRVSFDLCKPWVALVKFVSCGKTLLLDGNG